MTAPRRVGVVGLGAIGGSIASGLLANGWVVEGHDPDHSNRALAAGAGVALASTRGELVQTCDILVYATPLSVTLALIEEDQSTWREDQVVTDVASLKAPVMELTREATSFAGSHPLAGTEGSGFSAASPELFQGMTVWLCGSRKTPLERIAQMWRALGGKPHLVEPGEHDQSMSRVSHLPQLVANCLASILESEGVDPGDLGPGGRSMTRLAGSSPSMWKDLLEVAAAEDAAVLRRLGDVIQRVVKALDNNNIREVSDLMIENRAWLGITESDSSQISTDSEMVRPRETAVSPSNAPKRNPRS